MTAHGGICLELFKENPAYGVVSQQQDNKRELYLHPRGAEIVVWAAGDKPDTQCNGHDGAGSHDAPE